MTTRTTNPFLVSAAAVALTTVAIDQAMKLAAHATLALCSEPPASACDQVALFGAVRLIRVENAGSALGFMQGMGVWVLLAVAGLALVPLYARRFAAAPVMGALAAGLQTGGALGNLIDRLAFGGVTDFIEAGGGIVFNPADVALVAGMALAMLAMRRSSDRLAKAAPVAARAAAS
jgi:signal peptidase II